MAPIAYTIIVFHYPDTWRVDSKVNYILLKHSSAVKVIFPKQSTLNPRNAGEASGFSIPDTILPYRRT